MNKKMSFVCFGGYGYQYWTGIAEPTIRGNCNGITVCEMDESTGAMTVRSHTDGVVSPGTVCASPNGRFIYAANETSDFTKRGFGGGVSAFSFDPDTGKTCLINQSLAFGSFPAYIALDRAGEYLFTANHGSKLYCTRFENVGGKLQPKVIYDEGCVSMFAVREDGGVGELLDRIVFEGCGLEEIDHASSHPHCIICDNKDYIIIPDKGADCIYVCKLDREAKMMKLLSTYKTNLGSSPRHAAFVPETDIVLVVNEYDGHLCSYLLDRYSGRLSPVSRLYCGDMSKEYIHPFYGTKMKYAWANEVRVHPNGRFAYTNIDQQILSLFYIDSSTGELSLVEQTQMKEAVNGTTRGLQISLNGQYLTVAGLLNEKAFIYHIDSDTGHLSFASDIDLPTPTALCNIPITDDERIYND